MNTPENPVSCIPLELVSFSGNETISCEDCVSACCREGVAMPLTPAEVTSMTQAGTQLEKYDSVPGGTRFSRKERSQGKAYYQLRSDCGNLELPEGGGPGICKVFDSAERPAICGQFAVGSFCCGLMRVANDIPTSERALARSQTAG